MAIGNLKKLPGLASQLLLANGSARLPGPSTLGLLSASLARFCCSVFSKLACMLVNMDCICWIIACSDVETNNMKVSWDDDISNIWENNPNVPNHQPDYIETQEL
jgi:hypothetical protein